MKSSNFNAFVGTASGIFKGLNAIEKCETYVRNLDSVKNATNKNPITAMSWGDGEEILIGYGSQLVKIYDLKTNTFSLEEGKKCGDGAIIGISKYKGALLTAVESGVVKLWRNDSDPLVIDTNASLEKVKIGSDYANAVATGGKENDLKLWDLETGEKIFCAKNVRHDELDLRVPVHVSDIAFFNKTKRLAVTSRHGYVRLYDPSSNARRPVLTVQVPEQALTAISTSYRDHHVIVGSGTGQMNLVDLRSKGVLMNKYKGFTGGIKAIACSEDEPYIVSVSLDRHFRVHNLSTKELVIKEYLQSKLNCLLLRENFTLQATYVDCSGESSEEETPNAQEPEDEDSSVSEEAEDIFKGMSTVGEKRPKASTGGKKKHKS